MYNFFGSGSLHMYEEMKTRSVSPENPTGEKGGGARAVPGIDTLDVPLHETTDHLGRGWKNRPFISVKAGETVELMNVEGPGEIRHMWMLLWDQPQNDGVPRGGILRFYWDGEGQPSIDVPAADFFALGERFAEVTSAVVSVKPKNALTCCWSMPFRRHARVTFTNTGAEKISVMTYQITYVLKEIPENAMYFHARYHSANTADENPYVMLDGVTGRGRYVGSVLSVHSLADGWFGEGEFKFYIDGDGEFPTICGTGIEDYFLCSYGLSRYNAPFSGVPLLWPEDGGIRSGCMATMYRWHIPDPICFDESIRVTVQALGPIGGSSVYSRRSDIFSSVAYWYQLR